MDPLSVSLDFLEFPPSHTCDGGNLSPRIYLKKISPAAVSVAVMVFNPFEKSCCSFTPWICWNLPPSPVIPEGIPPGEMVTAPVPGRAGDHGPWYDRLYRPLPCPGDHDPVPVQGIHPGHDAGSPSRRGQACAGRSTERTCPPVRGNCGGCLAVKSDGIREEPSEQPSGRAVPGMGGIQHLPVSPSLTPSRANEQL